MNDLKINTYQKEYYGKSGTQKFFSPFQTTLEKLKSQGRSLKILDIGCGNGSIASALFEYFEGQAAVVGVDSTRYETWETAPAGVTFYECSCFDMDDLFPEEEFDVICSNCLIHHLIFPTFRETLKMQDEYLQIVKRLLKSDGLFLVQEATLESYVGNYSTYVHSYLTRISFPPLVSVMRKIGARSAGVGTFFRSLKKLREYFQSNGFQILSEIPATDIYRFPGLKAKLASIVLLCREHQVNVSFVMTPCRP